MAAGVRRGALGEASGGRPVWLQRRPAARVAAAVAAAAASSFLWCCGDAAS